MILTDPHDPQDPPVRRISCVIPAYNEGPRIKAVLDVVAAHPLIDEIIVVDDGSSDDTAAFITGREKVVLISLPKNGGKTRALAAGLAQAQGTYLLLVDSDLIGLGVAELTALILPVLEGRADMAISLRRNAPGLWHLIGIDYISGERMLRRSLIADRLAELDALPRFGFEVWLNRICIDAATRLAVVEWGHVDSPMKSRKYGALRGIVADLRMMADLLHSAGPWQLVRQIVRMRKLRVRLVSNEVGYQELEHQR
ncbi:glycosyltransferase [Rhodoferax sp.]|uniref:glycosyltransferase family 2 protein n=1 Tax=Rhodoferax sp. TaxID=50421 RepID=UPI0028465276|nr:glycosyltransferase [Rhodoferax sp.]MDR3369774.1 glycosyltransferase [Rhodoferax sp.]